MKYIYEISQLSKKFIVGLMSGTSADGIDAALVELDGYGVDTKLKLLSFHFAAYTKKVREQIFELFSPNKGCVEKICQMNFLLGKLFADAVVTVIDKAGLSPSEVHLIGSHGQTIYHLPPSSGAKVPSTLQIGEPAVIANLTGIPVIADFRVADVAAGGEGAPLVPYVDFLLFRKEKETRALQNIGGISNLTVIPPNAKLNEIVAFDTGPGNMLIDAAVNLLTSGKKQFDPDGSIAAKGQTNKELLSELMAHPFITGSPPKTTGREEFGVHFAQKYVEKAKMQGIIDLDILATFTEFTAKSIYENYKKFIFPKHNIHELILSGGGIYNSTLVKKIKRYFQNVSITKIDEYGINSDAKEAVAFAVLANETLMGNPNNVPNVTGARNPVILGKIIPSSQYLKTSLNTDAGTMSNTSPFWFLCHFRDITRL